MADTQPLSPSAIERELRTRLTPTEYRLLQARLTHAVKAIAMLRERASDLLPLMVTVQPLKDAAALPWHTQHALGALLEELLIATGQRERTVSRPPATPPRRPASVVLISDRRRRAGRHDAIGTASSRS